MGTSSVHPAPQGRPFLTAEWRDLVMLNYEVDAALLAPYTPRGTELDRFGQSTLVSLVGFRFLRTRLFGIVPVPFHANFDEVNLRFYVRRRDETTGEVRRGVVFLREIVPRRAIALVARLAYNENYSRYKMRHEVSANAEGVHATYGWRAGEDWMGLRAEGEGEPQVPADGSAEQFVTEHYWGYARQRGGGTFEYQVAHPPWRVWRGAKAEFFGDGLAVYGPVFGVALGRRPDSAFIAEGSAVRVFAGRRIA